MSATIGFIGLGRMGLPMSYNLLRAGYDLTVHNRSQEKVHQIADAGATAAASAAELTASCEIVLACLPDVATCEEVMLGDSGVLQNARPGQVIVDHSTVGASTSKACAAAAQAKGAIFLDAPISGGDRARHRWNPHHHGRRPRRGIRSGAGDIRRYGRGGAPRWTHRVWDGRQAGESTPGRRSHGRGSRSNVAGRQIRRRPGPRL